LNILDIWVDPVNRNEAIRRVEVFLREGSRPHTVFASNPEKNFSVPRDSVLYKTFKCADLLLPDGIGMILAARILYKASLERVPGSELIFDICNLAANQGYGIFVYGAREEINKKAVEILQKRYPDLRVAGRENGYIADEEMADLIRRINSSKAEILFLALGSPRQEKWFATYKNDLNHIKVCQTIGGTLDTIAGNVKRAPLIWQKFSAEWLYRLIKEPKRIKRQKVLPAFAIKVLISKLKSLARTENRN
jgi:N-acetylglucosaminyldiphosphoundecaprenol N-acetyl-beta-D-mannosaminyltransferase